MADGTIRSALESAFDAVIPSAEAAEAPSQASGPKFVVINHKTGMQVGGPYSTVGRARTALDKFDNEYGGYAHKIVPVGGQK